MTRRRKMEALQDLVEEAKRRTVLWVIFVFGLAYMLSLTSSSMYLNIPIAVLLLAAIRYLSFELEIRRRIQGCEIPSQLAHLLKHQLSSNDPVVGPSPVSTKWRRKIDSPLVEASISDFTHCIVKEFVTDLWFSSLSPDQDVPQQIEFLINDIFGEIAQRAKRINLINLMTRDLVELVGTHLELFRQTKAEIGVKLFETFSSEEREERLKLVLMRNNKLHPALVSAESECKVLQKMMSGVVAILLRPQDAQCTILRGLARELLACAVMKPVMNFASPSFINKAIERAISSAKEKSSGNIVEKGTVDGSSTLKSSGGVIMKPARADGENQMQHKSDASRVIQSSLDSNAKQGDWAQALEAMSKRRTTTLAPENLDNLWTKGRNYKKRELERAMAKPNQVTPLSVISRNSYEFPSKLSPTKTVGTGIHALRRSSEDPLVGNHIKVLNRGRSLESIQNNSVNSEEPFGIELYNSKLKASNNGLESWQNLRKPTTNPEKNLSYWDNPEIQLSTGSPQLDHAKEWNNPDGVNIKSTDQQPATCKLNCWVVGAHLEKISSNTFAVYSIAVTDSHNKTWFVERRFRNFEQLHRNLRDLPQYNLQLPPKRILSSSLDDSFVRDRCILLDKYLKDLLSIPSIAELHEVWDFLSVTSKKYSFSKSSSVMKTIAVNVDDAMDDMVRQLKGVSDGIFRQLGASSPPRNGGLHSITGDYMKRTGALGPPIVSGMTNSLEREKSDLFSDDGSGGIPEEDGSNLVDSWHSDSELQVPDSGSRALSQRRASDDGQRNEKRIKRAISDLLPEETSGGLGPVNEEDPEVPPEWTPPKLTLPLLNLVDSVFQLKRRGWIRRQVFWMAKQILQLGMGDAVDDWLVSQVQWLRTEQVVADSIKWAQGVLWPGGIFITKVKKDDVVPVTNNNMSKAPKQSTTKGLDQSALFESQLEASRCARVVYEVLVEGGPAALVSLVGKRQYTKCAKDIYYFLQSTIFLKQLTYSVLETLLVTTFPELTHLLYDIRQGSGQVVI